MPEGQTEVERRYLKSGKKPVQMQKTNIFARIPLPPQCMHWGTFPPGEGFVTAPQLPHKLQFDDIHKHAPPGSAEHVLIDLQVHPPAGGMGFQSGGEQLVAALRLVGTEAAEAAGQSTQLTDKGGKHL